MNKQVAVNKSKTWLWIVGGVVVLIVGLLIYAAVQNILRVQDVDYPDNPLELFKYTSIGAEQDRGVPFPIWKALPKVCKSLLPDPAQPGYRSFGFIYEAGHEPADQPVGIALRTVGVTRAGTTCSQCHTGTVRLTKDGPTQVIYGMPAHQLRMQNYVDFLYKCGSDTTLFTTDKVMAVIQKENNLNWFELALYRFYIIPETVRVLKTLDQIYPWHNGEYQQPDFGLGRVNAFLAFQAKYKSGGSPIGVVDLPAVWNQGVRFGGKTAFYSHWDGNNSSIAERNRSAAISVGADDSTIDFHSLDVIGAWLWELQPPKYPLPIDSQLAAKGKPIYDAQCASCHDLALDGKGGKVGQTTPLAEIGTDPARFNAFTQALADAMNANVGKGYSWHFTHYRKSDGYANVPLDGIWARAPYLHNGSVPTLRDLLKPVEDRPKSFYPGYDLFDSINVGFISSGPEAEKVGFKFDTSVEGNFNTGHLYGTDLSEADKDALLEFLKTQ